MTIRRLAAILAADVVGFSWMMEKDEEVPAGCAARNSLSARMNSGLPGALP